jgi:DNA polymerase-4
MVWPLACRKINGIGPKADEKLQSFGITTIGQLASHELQWLIDRFGQKTGAWMYDAARGQDERPIVLASEPVSISRETSFERDLHAVRDKAELGAIFTALCEQLAADLLRKGYAGKTIGIKLRYDDFKSITRDLTIATPTLDAKTIRQAAGQCLKRAPLAKKLRLLGVRAGALVRLEDLAKFKPNTAVESVDTAQAATNLVADDGLSGQLF